MPVTAPPSIAAPRPALDAPRPPAVEGSVPPSAPTTGTVRSPLAVRVAVLAGVLLGLAVLVTQGLRDFAFNDYESEAKPAIDRLLAGDLSGFLSVLPGYGGAVILQAPFAPLGNLVGPDHDLWTWRALAVPGLASLAVLGGWLGLRVGRARPGRRGAVTGGLTALLVTGSPFAMLALDTGHPEELLVTAMAVGGVLLAAGGRVTVGAGVVALAAVAKPWAVIAMPVVLLAAEDRRQLARAVVVAGIAGLALLAPILAANGGDRAAGMTHASTSGIFKPTNVFWFFGTENPDWSADGNVRSSAFGAAQAVWAQRLEPAWAARVSHPLIVLFAGAVALAFAWLRRRDAIAVRRQDLLLLLAAACWWRCLLDTWNVHYYALGAIVALAAWEAHRRRFPVAALLVTLAAWVTFEIFPGSMITPDGQTALYLAWGVPLGLWLVARALWPAALVRASDRLIGRIARALPTLAAWSGRRPATAAPVAGEGERVV
ncbi:MAG: hypothetical protein M0P31_06730 [Solirubrobacteraceae bacterium]|nr:hypothetical protein [Solirubrobacteraceae bacterium]